MTQFLVSVRSAGEAVTARAGGAGLIDVKEPARGALGRADEAVLADVLRASGSCPVSAALGELFGADADLPDCVGELAYLKWGLAGAAHQPLWRDELAGRARLLERLAPGCRLVTVAYADWRRAAAPPPAEVVSFACQLRAGPLLVDTFGKDGTTLLDLLALDEVADLCRSCRAVRVPIALAGSLGPAEVERLLPLAPDWFAVRAAVCCGGRGGTVDLGKVQHLARLLSRAG
jgi:uncharacterized protein (UPF0264 family)